MEEKLVELIKIARECGKVSKKYFVEVHYLGENEIRVDVRSKRNFIFVNTMQTIFDEGIFTTDEIIEKLKKIIKEES